MKLFLVAATWSVASTAFAHHGMHGRMPATFAEGLLSGLAHPVIGLDHLLAVCALGLLAALPSGSFALPAVFVLSTVAGSGIHLMGLGLPASETLVALSVSAFGALLLLVRALERSRAFALASIAALLAGIAHGYAYGESIVGAEPTPLGAYLFGFIAVQLAICAAARAAAKAFLSSSDELRTTRALRFAGVALVLAGSTWAALGVIA